MTHILTIVAPETLSDADLQQVASSASFTRLDHRAADIFHDDVSWLQSAKLDTINSGFDAHVSEIATRQKALLICDMDSTIIQQECIDELGVVAGVGEQIAAVTEKAMRGELDFDEALTSRVAQLAGVPETAVATLLDQVISLSPGAKTLVGTMKHHGAMTALVSGGFTLFTGPIAARAGFAFHRANQLEVESGQLTGRVIPPILGREAKRETLLSLCNEQGIAPASAVAIGDGANDLAMIDASGLGIAYKAKPAVKEAADAAIEHTDLTAALYFQGLVPVSP